MIKATLKYTDCLADGKNMFRVLVDNGVEIIATKPAIISVYARVVVLFNNTKHMYDTLYDLNRMCNYEVVLVKFQHLKEKKPV